MITSFALLEMGVLGGMGDGERDDFGRTGPCVLLASWLPEAAGVL